MRTFALLILLVFVPLQGLVLFCPFELEAGEAESVLQEGASAHDSEAGEPGASVPRNAPATHAHAPATHAHGPEMHAHGSAPEDDAGAHNSHHGAGEECVAMAACSAPVAPAPDAAPVWDHVHPTAVHAASAHAPLALLSPADPPPPRST